LRDQLIVVGELHDKDLAEGYDGVFLDDDLEKKYPKAPKEFMYQWFFPQKPLTAVVETGELRRYHLHESELQEALYYAVRRARSPKNHRSHLSALLRHTSLTGKLRHPHHPDAAGTFKPEDYHDLYPLCSGQDGQGSEEPA
jgi:hypothetical protein